VKSSRIALLGASLLLAACAKDRSGASGSSGLTVSGRVVMGAPVVGATITLYAVDPDTRKLTRIDAATTDARGAYTVGTVLDQPFLIVASGGTYVDDFTGEKKTLAPAATFATLDDARAGVLEAIVGHERSPSVVHLTPFTTIASRRALAAAATATVRRDALTEEQVRGVNEAAARALRVGSAGAPVDPRALVPLDYTDKADAIEIQKAPLGPAALYGAALSGLSLSADKLKLSSPTPLIDAIARDFEDGKLDGANTAPGSVPVPIQLGSAPLSPTAGTADLQQATMEFLADPVKNASGTPLRSYEAQ
jgi:hypothetical protein